MKKNRLIAILAALTYTSFTIPAATISTTAMKRTGEQIELDLSAVSKNKIDEVRHLIEAGAKVDTRSTDRSADTALMIACKNGLKDMVELLLKANANLELFNDFGERAIDIAERKGFKTIVSLLENELLRKQHAQEEIAKLINNQPREEKESKEVKEEKKESKSDVIEIDLANLKKYVKPRGAILSILAAMPLADDETEFEWRNCLRGINENLKYGPILSLLLNRNETLERYFKIDLLKPLISNAIRGLPVTADQIKNALNMEALLELINCTPKELPAYIDLYTLTAQLANLLNGHKVAKKDFTNTIKLEKIRLKIESADNLNKFIKLYDLLLKIIDEINQPETSLKKLLKHVNAALIIPEFFTLIRINPKTIEKYGNIEKIHQIINKKIDGQEITEDDLDQVINFKALSDLIGIDIIQLRKYVQFKKLAILMINKISNTPIVDEYKYIKETFNFIEIETDFEIIPGLFDEILKFIYNRAIPTEEDVLASEKVTKNKYRLQGLLGTSVIGGSWYALSLLAKYGWCALGTALSLNSVTNSDHCPDLWAPESALVGSMFIGGLALTLQHPRNKINMICASILNKPRNLFLRALSGHTVFKNTYDAEQTRKKLQHNDEFKPGENIQKYLGLTAEQISKLSDRDAIKTAASPHLPTAVSNIITDYAADLLEKANTNPILLTHETEFIKTLTKEQFDKLARIIIK